MKIKSCVQFIAKIISWETLAFYSTMYCINTATCISLHIAPSLIPVYYEDLAEPIAWQYHMDHYYDDSFKNDITIVFEEHIHQQ